jgi:hypothetical protein
MRKDVEDKANEINKIQIFEGRHYEWVWEYAKFRFNQSIDDMNRAQEKASSLLKLVILGFAAFWTLFVYFFKDSKVPLAAAFNYHILLGLGGLMLSAAICIYCLLPVRQLLLYGEDVAIRFINETPELSPVARTRFALGLKLCSDFQERRATRKFEFVFVGFILLVCSLGLLFSGFYHWMLLSQSCGH